MTVKPVSRGLGEAAVEDFHHSKLHKISHVHK